MTPIATVVNALETHGCRPRERGGQGNYVAHCPAHDDEHASLVIGEGGDGKALIRCWAGCSTGSVIEALDLGWSDLFEESVSPMQAWTA